MRKIVRYLTLSVLVLIVFFDPTAAKEVFASPQGQITTAGQLIDAVNNLRISYGLPALASHPILMQSAQSQADYMAAIGYVTHSRPGGTTYTQQLLSLGFPLAGDLSLGGFRSENILNSSSPIIWDGVPSAWQDSDHMNTMLSQNFTNIGAGVSQSANGYFYAVDTAAATGNGQMQESASSALGSSGSSGQAAGVSQYMVAVMKSTALPSGDVIHTVQYGQTLWSIAIEYGTTIKNIQALNNLGEDLVVYQGQALLVQKAATQPAPDLPTATLLPPVTQTAIPTSTVVVVSPTVQISTPTVEVQAAETSTSKSSSSQILVAVLIVAAVVGAGVAVWLIRDPD
ncbi:MAG: CAP domain-containing protein [Anaerolineales bacterium]